MIDLKIYLKERKEEVDHALGLHLPHTDDRPALLHEAMRYAVLSGGKRLRPVLCLAAYDLLGDQSDSPIMAAIALEVLHTYTLIHDDLPCMDDDNLRRGEPTTHKKYGEANAILAGDALLTLAFEWIAQTIAPEPYLPSQCSLELAEAAGSHGIIAGQVEDLAAEGKEPDADLVDYIHLHKTAVLFRSAVRIGGICAGATSEQLDAFTLYGCNLGLAFQIADDILDVTGTTEELGKPTGSDQELKKLTYVAVHGLDASRERAQTLVGEAIGAVEKIDRNTEVLAAIARFSIERTL